MSTYDVCMWREIVAECLHVPDCLTDWEHKFMRSVAREAQDTLWWPTDKQLDIILRVAEERLSPRSESQSCP